MSKSMTAFSRSSEEHSWGSLVWELRSVNHRYLDVTMKLPEELRGIENEIRERLGEQLKRGKIECNLRYKPVANKQTALKVNEDFVREVLDACHIISTKSHQPNEMNVLDILKWPGVIEESSVDMKPVIEATKNGFSQALNQLVEVRKSEGERLQKMLQVRCEAMKEIVLQERDRRPQVLEDTKQKILKKLAQLKTDYDEDRLEQELVYLAQKMDVDEELDRIDSHFVEMEKTLKSNDAIGRRLDFIMQEFNREANTLGSKSSNIKTTQASLELKVLIEQMREQVQNIE